MNVYDGYDVEFLYEIAKYTNWKYDFIDFKDFESAFDAVKKGEVDMITNLFYSPERAKSVLFSEEGMGKQYITITVSADDTRHEYGKLESFANEKIGVLSGWLETNYFLQLDKENNLHAQIYSVKTVEELFNLLETKKVDGVVISYQGPSDKFRVAYEFDPVYNYFAFAKKRTDLCAALNVAMDRISLNNPDFKTELSRKYFYSLENRKPEFTDDEQKYIKENKTITIGMGDNNQPFSYRGKDGKMYGAVPDMLKQIETLSGLHIACEGLTDLELARSNLHEGKIQAIAKLTASQTLMAFYGIRLTDSYMKLPLTEITRKGTTVVHSIAIPEEVGIVYARNPGGVGVLSGYDIHYMPTVHQSFELLRKRKVDAVICDNVSASYFLNNSRASNFVMAMFNEYTYDVAIGVDVNSDNELFSILNKCILYNKQYSVDEIVQKYSLAADTNPFSFVNKIPTIAIVAYTIILMFAIVSLVIALLLMRRHAQKEKELETEQEKLKLQAKATAERTELFGNISHDMRTPLNGILGFTNIALEENTNPLVAGYLTKIQISGNLLLQLVNDTLFIAKTQSDKFGLHSEVISSKEIFEDVIVPIKAAADQKNIQFIVAVERAKNYLLKVDRLNIQKVFLNLLANAVKFTQPGGRVELDIDTHTFIDKNHIDCKVTVRDNGIGMKPEFIPKIYEPFSQENPGKNGNVGTGLGLHIVKRLVDVMNGTISVESKKNEGTEFVVHLPLEFLSEYGERTDTDKGEVARQVTACLTGKRILLCEDNEMNQEIAKILLERSGAIVETAQNGKEGVALFERSKQDEFAAILMDIRMPVMNGYDAAIAIRSLNRSDAKDIPIIALSADAYEEDQKKSLRAGMNDHVAKPIDANRLLLLLCKLIV